MSLRHQAFSLHRGRPLVVAFAAVALAVTAASARAVPEGCTVTPDAGLAQARAAYQAIDYAQCGCAARAALAAPAPFADRVDAHRLVGLCAAALGDAAGARDAFQMMLVLDPQAKLPDGLSPRFTSAFREAKGNLAGGAPLTLTVVHVDEADGVRTVRLAVKDELDLVKRIGWRGEGGAVGPPVRRAPQLELEVPAASAVTVYALDDAGGEVALVELPAAGAPQTDGPIGGAPLVAADPGPPWPLIGGIAGGVAVLAAIGVVVVAATLPPSHVTLKTAVIFAE